MSGIIGQRGFNRSGMIGPTAPNTPYFNAQCDGTQTNLTSSGTPDHVIIFQTLITNTGGHYNNSNGIFTAPVTGVYLFCCSVMASQVDADHTYTQIKLHTSNKDAYDFQIFQPTHVLSADTTITLNGSHTIDMDENDTAFMEIRFTSGHTTSDVTDNSYFNGILLS